MEALGIDIGGSGIKGAPVDLEKGELTRDRFKIETPQPSTPEAVADAVRRLVKHFDWAGPIGITFPSVVVGGVTRTAANVDQGWVDLNARELFSLSLGTPVTVLNDADAAGVAELSFGAGRGRDGVVLLLTFGTGIGSALFSDGKLVPNTELGHVELNGHDAEKRASAHAKEVHKLSYPEWAERVDVYLKHIEMLLSPQLFIIGGGISRKSEKFLPLLTGLRAEVVPATLQNNAGIVGAAMAAATDKRG